uniref:DUF4485 domain-containing protein n=1 Tax=Stomoxys calcitrans TaxID=35570 RepID=A0A1I8P385_STOCA
MDIEQQQDFLFLLEMCKSPENVFPVGSKDFELTQKWLNYLSTYQCEDRDEMRLVNVYMSHLCSGLVEGKLYGPFLKEPTEGKLQKFVLYAENVETSKDQFLDLPETSTAMGSTESIEQMTNSDQPSSNAYKLNNVEKSLNSKAYETHGHVTAGSTNLYFHVSTGGNQPSSSSCHCPPQYCQCAQNSSSCTCNRTRAGADSTSASRLDEGALCDYLMHELNLTPDFLKGYDAKLNSFLDLCKECNSDEALQAQFLEKLKSAHSQFTAKQDGPAPLKIMSEDICELLEAILSELKGATKPGASYYLERELCRYHKFLMSHSDMAQHLKILSSEMELRLMLLLSLQNDLVKLMCDAMENLSKSN